MSVRRNSLPTIEGREISSAPTPQSPMILDTKQIAQRNETEEISANAVFSSDPLPENLLFPGSDSYLIDLPKIGYDDHKYTTRKILSQTLLVLNSISKTREELYKQIKQIKSK